MAQNNNKMDTVPGFTVESDNFMVKFISGIDKKGLLSELFEYETDWTDVFNMILDTLERSPTSVMITKNILATSLENWVTSHPGAENLNIKVNITMEEKVYYTNFVCLLWGV